MTTSRSDAATAAGTVISALGGVALIAMVAVSVRWGRSLQRTSPEIFLGAAPFVGRNFRDGWDWRFGVGLVGAAVVAIAVVVGTWRRWWWTTRLRWVVVASAAGASLFASALALTDGADGILYGVEHDTEYLDNLAVTPPAAEFVRTFVDEIDRYSVHVRGHPPGYTLVLKFLDGVHLAGPWPVAMLSIAATGAVAAGVLVAVWALAGHTWVRRIAPMLIVAPYALWMVSSADAVFSAVGAWGVATCAIGQRSAGWRAAAWGALGGVLLGGLLFLTYGGALFLLVPSILLGVAFVRRRRGHHRHRGAGPTIIAATSAIVVVTIGFVAAGFWWFAGASATRREYWEGTAQFRPFGYFAVANLAVAAMAVGPSTIAGLVTARRHRHVDRWPAAIVLAACTALVAAQLSQYTRAEVERIWLIFFPFIAVAGGWLVGRQRRLLACTAVTTQAVSAIVLQAALVSKW